MIIIIIIRVIIIIIFTVIREGIPEKNLLLGIAQIGGGTHLSELILILFQKGKSWQDYVHVGGNTQKKVFFVRLLQDSKGHHSYIIVLAMDTGLYFVIFLSIVVGYCVYIAFSSFELLIANHQNFQRRIFLQLLGSFSFSFCKTGFWYFCNVCTRWLIFGQDPRTAPCISVAFPITNLGR